MIDEHVYFIPNYAELSHQIPEFFSISPQTDLKPPAKTNHPSCHHAALTMNPDCSTGCLNVFICTSDTLRTTLSWSFMKIVFREPETSITTTTPQEVPSKSVYMRYIIHPS